MYILQTDDDINFRIVASCHPDSVPDSHKRVMPVANAQLTTFGVYTDKSWEKLPLTKKYSNPWPLEWKPQNVANV